MIWGDETDIQGATIEHYREDKVSDSNPKCNSMTKYLVNEYSPQMDDSENGHGC